MGRKRLSPIRKFQKKAIEGSGKVAGITSETSAVVSKKLKRIDESYEITDSIRNYGMRGKEFLNRLNGEYGVTKRARRTGEVVSETARSAANVLGAAADATGVNHVARTVGHTTTSALKNQGLDKRLAEIGRALENVYGSSRSFIKPYFLPETPDELLINTKKELSYISACIMQVSPGEAEKLASQFGTVVASKIAGVAASGALLSLVSTFGTAGTGTAIASLSGAASTSATLAWVGGLLGGGMATGAVLTGGVSIVVGLGAYKSLKSEKRNFEDLEEVEQRIVQYCWMLIAILDDYLGQKKKTFTDGQAKYLLVDTLLPLQEMLKNNEEKICKNLDKKNAAAYRQHVLRDFRPTVTDAFREFIRDKLVDRTLHYEYVIGGVLYALLNNSVVDESFESQLVLEAIRRSDRNLSSASELEISRHLAEYNEEQLKGIANNVKGIYHELLWREQYNASNSETRAVLHESTTHPGADVQIIDVDSGEVVAEYQLKATNSIAYIEDHRVRYVDIEVIATNEVANQMEGVSASGYQNADISLTTEDCLAELAENTLVNKTFEGAGLASTVATGQELVEMLQGRKEFPEAVKEIMKKTTAAGAAVAIATYLFN